MKQSEKQIPLVLTIDDDEDINKLIEHRIKAMGFHCATSTTPEEFFKKFDEKTPKLCIVDMHLQKEVQGLAVIEEISKRSKLSADIKPYIVVLSSLEDQKLISYAIELGADDYWLKPLNRFYFQDRIAKYFQTPVQNEKNEPYLRSVPDEYQAVKVGFFGDLTEINEFGVKLSGPDLLTKGCFLYLFGDEIEKATGKKPPVSVSVTSNWLDTESGQFCAMAEFDFLDEDLINNVRLWISAQKEKKSF